MWIQLGLEQLHFALNVFAALVMGAVFWLHFDAWSTNRSPRGIIKFVGFFLLTIFFLVQATILEVSFVAAPILGGALQTGLSFVLAFYGYSFLIIGQIVDPIESRPKVKDPLVPAIFVGSVSLAAWAGPVGFFVLALVAAGLYFRRAIVGLEEHMRSVGVAFIFLALSHLLAAGAAFRQTTNIVTYGMVAPFGPIWILQQVFLVVAMVILWRWVFGYLLKRFETQLMMIFTVSVVLIYVVTTITFTALLLQDVQNEILGQLRSDVRVLAFALESKKAEVVSDAQVLAQNPLTGQFLTASSKKELRDLVEGYFLSKRQSVLTVLSANGQIVARGEDRDHFGGTLPPSLLTKRALLGETVSTVEVGSGVVAPEISVVGAAPIKVDGQVVGVVLAGTSIDNAFVDGIKRGTGLESTVYANDQISATTLVASDGVTRPLGAVESRADIKETVLAKKSGFQDQVTFLGQPYFAAYEPIEDIDNSVVGMVLVGKPQVVALETAGKSIELTFVVAAILMVISVVPAYLMAKMLGSQLR